MRRCTRCSLQFEESTKICRSCGGILEEVEGESAPALDTVVEDWLQAETADASRPLTPIDELAGDLSPAVAEWNCPHCKESVPAEFDKCWNCGMALKRENNPAIAGQSADTDSECVALQCAACGSGRMIPDVHVCDQGQHSGGQLVVVVYGDPQALLFKERLYGAVTADICGECGHVQLRVRNHADLYERYLRSAE